MRSILRGRDLQPDTWRHAGEEGGPEATGVVVPLDQLLADADALSRRSGKLGVRIGPADDVQELVPFLDRLALVAIEFPAFGEGRGYSQAHLLRERLAFKGEVRAVGIVKQDQIYFMHRAGFDAFELSAGQSAAAAVAAMDTFTATYQSRQVRWR